MPIPPLFDQGNTLGCHHHDMKNHFNNDPARAQLTGFINKISAMPKPSAPLCRFQAHLNELLSVRDGNAYHADHCRRAAALGAPSREEAELCRNMLTYLETVPDWYRESDVLRRILGEIENDQRHTGATGPKARVIAFYLPQYHPIPENDKWWGKGFTEWTNVGKAKPLYRGHEQPQLPAELGYYDLRVPETRSAQAELARTYGIEAFCYWHYWFAGHRLLERPFTDVVKSGEPDFPFCLGWANQTWSGIWHGAPDKILIEQTYPGLADYKAHFDALLPAFTDKRYLKVNGKLVFLIYSPQSIPNPFLFTEYWQQLAESEGLPGFHFIAHMSRTPENFGCQSCVDNAPFYDMNAPLLGVEPVSADGVPRVVAYGELVKYLERYQLAPQEHPLVFPNWDNTPRSGKNGIVLQGSTPEQFEAMMNNAVRKAGVKSDPDQRLVFIKAWNEWAEGNHLEPDVLHGHRYLEAVRNSVYGTSVLQ